jgi:cellulose synthase operon protein YhjQ
MSTSSDIANLFKRLGTRSDQYQEITEKNEGRASLERWPSMAKAKVEEVKPPSPVDAVQPNVEAGVRSRLSGSPVHDSQPLAKQRAQADVSSHPQSPEPSTEGSFNWAAESLQSMLGKLDRAQYVDDLDIEPEPEPELRVRPHLANIKIVAVISGKGGVGKSTVAANLGTTWQRQGKAVLVVDLDPQNALRNHLGLTFEPGAEEQLAGIAQLSEAEEDLRERCQLSPAGVSVLPFGSVDEARRRAFERQLDSEPDWLAQRLAELQLSDGAVVILDTPPGPSVYLQQALTVANLALVVTLSDAASYATLPMIDNLIQTYTAERSEFMGAFYAINQVDSSRQLNKDVTLIMRNILGKRLIGLIHRDQSIAEALAYNRSVLDYDPSGRGCHDIQAVSVAVLEKLSSTERGIS